MPKYNDDLISRQEAIDALWKALYSYEDKTEKQFIESKDLDVRDWMLHRNFVQNMSDIDRKTILDLPPVQPERKKGKWISHPGSLRCSSCGVLRIGGGKSNFCPNCGADMREEKPKKGTWIWGYDVRCSNCCYKLQTTGLPSRCPNCGADMIGTTLDDR